MHDALLAREEALRTRESEVEAEAATRQQSPGAGADPRGSSSVQAAKALAAAELASKLDGVVTKQQTLIEEMAEDRERLIEALEAARTRAEVAERRAKAAAAAAGDAEEKNCLLYTSPSPRDATLSRMPSSA